MRACLLSAATQCLALLECLRKFFHWWLVIPSFFPWKVSLSFVTVPIDWLSSANVWDRTISNLRGGIYQLPHLHRSSDMPVKFTMTNYLTNTSIVVSAVPRWRREWVCVCVLVFRSEKFILCWKLSSKKSKRDSVLILCLWCPFCSQCQTDTEMKWC